MAETKQPTPEQMEDMQAVATAGGETAAKGGTPEQTRDAMKDERDKRNMTYVSDEDLKKMAAMITGQVIEGLDERGAFDPIEPVQPAQTPTAPPAPGEQPAAAPAPETVPQPRKQNFAERFMGS